MNTPLQTLFHRVLPTSHRSRVFSVISILAQITPLGSAVFGFAVDRLPVHYLVLISCIANAILTIVFLAKGMSRLFEVRPGKHGGDSYGNAEEIA